MLYAELLHQSFLDLLHLILNAYWEPLDFELPQIESGRHWRRWIDTSLDSPQDIVPWRDAQSLAGCSYKAAGRSVAVLLAPVGELTYAESVRRA